MEQPQFQHPQSQTKDPAYGQVYSDTQDINDLQTQLQDLGRKFEQFKNKRINWNTDIIGLYETVSVVPTLVPMKPYDQIKIYTNSTTYRLYWYDSVNQAWRYATGT